MDANEVKNLKWISVTDWSDLPKTRFDRYGIAHVGEADVDSFVENVFKEVSRRLNIPYSELEPILKEENSAFYSTKSRLFGKYESFFSKLFGISVDIEEFFECLDKLEKVLRIPDVTDINKSDVDRILNDFSALADREKLEVLQRLGTVSVKVIFSTK